MPGVTLDLSTLGLGSGEHYVRCGPYQLTFSTFSVERCSELECVVGLNSSGELSNVSGATMPLVAGVGTVPYRDHVGALHFCPADPSVMLLGEQGEAAEIHPTMASWAGERGLECFVFDPEPLSSYPYSDRVVKYPWWIAGYSSGSVWLRMYVHFGHSTDDRFDEPEMWRDAVSRIGPNPRILADNPEENERAIIRWHEYMEVPAQ